MTGMDDPACAAIFCGGPHRGAYDAGVGVLDHASNRDQFDYLRANARPGTGRREAGLDGWELHTHPDLIGRLAQFARSGQAVVSVYGVMAVAQRGVAAVVALGTDTLLFRLPTPPTDVDMGQSQLPSAEGLHRLTRLLAEARRYANEIATEPV